VPDTLVDVIRSRSGTKFCGITSDYFVPFICLEIPDRSGEETSSDEIEEAGGDDQKELELGRSTTP
jgi:hypothetical protein